MLGMLLLAGCQQEQITSYRVPRLQEPEAEPAPDTGRPATRMLAAIVPHAGRTWFFKLLGPEEAVGAQEEAFEQFLKSVKLTDKEDRPVAWTLPEGWKEEPGSQMRYATLRLGTADAPLELSVTPLGEEAGTMVDNINRWRGQMGLGNLTGDEVAKVTREFPIDGKSGTLVDMKAPASAAPAPRVPPFMAGGNAGGGNAAGGGDRPSGPFAYKLPEGWTKSDKRVAFSVATFQVTEGGQAADITISPLSGAAGGLVENVNRWRNQLGMGSVGEEQIRRDVGKFPVAGQSADYVDLTGPESAGPQRRRILAVLLPRDDTTWFFKMSGPAELVAKEKAAFEQFLGTVRFEQGTGK